jgi:tetrahydromethanopterin S-methyltransferase subunit G
MEPRSQPKTASEMQRMRKGRNFGILGIIAGLVILFYVLTLVKIGGAS